MKRLIILLLVAVLSITLMSITGCEKEADASTVRVDASFNGEGGEIVKSAKTYKTVNEALNYFISADLGDQIKTIRISAGDYYEKISIPETLTNVVLIGATDGITKITYDDYADKLDENGVKLGTDRTATLDVKGEGFSASNIIFENSFDYMNPPPRVGNKQALAAYVKADKIVFNKCSFTGHQDTLEAVRGRQYYKDCLIYGHTDFIFGNNSASLFEGCEIKTRYRNNSNGGYITASKGNNGTNGQEIPKFGFVFKNCKLTADEGVINASVALGRPWRANSVVSYLNCEMGKHISTIAYDGKDKCQRYVHMYGADIKNLPQDANFTEYNNTGDGAIATAVNGCTMLTDVQAAEYTLTNIFAITNGAVTYSGEWDAAAALSKIS